MPGSACTALERGYSARQAGEQPLAVAIIGRPNVGKSSLLNALAGSERSIVSPIAGTTRDAVDTQVPNLPCCARTRIVYSVRSQM